MKKVLSLLLVSVMLLGCLASCSSLKDGEKGAMIKMCVSSLPTSFDPSAYVVDASSNKIFSLIYMTLTTLNDDGKVKEGLASEWGYTYDDIYREHKMYFILKESGWSDGRSLSASDYAYAWKRILSPKNDSPYASLLFPIKNAKEVKSGDMTSDDLGVVAVSETRLEVTFADGYVNGNGKEVANQFAEIVANIAFAPLREDRVESTDDWTNNTSVSNIICNGPFYVRSYSDTEGLRILELERNKYYLRNDEEDDALDKSVLPYQLICEYDGTDDLKAESEKFKSGDSFYLAEFTPETYKNHSVTSTDSLSTYVYYFNTQNSLFTDANVRRALSMAIDRNHVASIIGCGSVASTGFVPTGVFDTDKGTSFRSKGGNLYSTTADVEGAKNLLSGKTGMFTITYVAEADSDVNRQVAEYVKGIWEGLGFAVDIEGVTASEARNNLYSCDYDVMAIDFSVSSTNAVAYLASFASGFSGRSVDLRDSEFVDVHFTGYNSEAYNELIESAVYQSDRSKRASKLHEAEKLLVDDCPAFALVSYKNSYVASKKLDDYEHNYIGAPVFEELELDDWRDVNAKIEKEREVKE